MTEPIRTIKNIRIEEILLFLMLLVFPLDKVFSLLGGSTVQDYEGITLSYLFLALLIACCGWKTLWKKDTLPIQLLRESPVPILILLFIGSTLLSVIVSRFPMNAVQPTIMRLGLFVFYMLLLYVMRDRFSLRMCIWGFVLSAFITGFAGVYEIVAQEAILEADRYSDVLARGDMFTEVTGTFRIQGLSRDPCIHGAQLLIQLGLACYLFCTADKWPLKGLVGFLIILMTVNVIAAGARALWLFLFINMGLFLVLAPMRYKSLIIGSAIGMLIAAFIAIMLFFPQLAVFDRISGKKNVGSFSTNFRKEMMLISWEMGRKHPILGIGTGNFREEYPDVKRHSPFLPRKVIPVPHNIYLGIFAENGLVGLVFYCLFQLAVFLQAVYCYRYAPDRDMKYLAAALICGFITFTYSLNWYPMWGSKYAWTIIAMCGASMSIIQLESARAGSTPADGRDAVSHRNSHTSGSDHGRSTGQDAPHPA